MRKGLSRRGFLKSGVVAGVAVRVGLFAGAARADLLTTGRDGLPAWADADGRPRFRMDAVAKVTGDKSFARDFRARDIPGWPDEQSHAFLLYAGRTDRAFEGLDLSRLHADLQPDRVVLAEDLARDGLSPPGGADGLPPGFYGDVFLVPKGEAPRLLGQPVALLLYRDFARCDAARRRLRFDTATVRFGAEASPTTPPSYLAARFVRIGGAKPEDPDVYAPLDGAVVHGSFVGDDVVWPAADAGGDAVAKAMWAAGEIEREIAGAGPDALVLTRDYASQSIDSSPMEADNANAWYDPASGALHLLAASQSPYEVAQATASMLARSRFAVKSVDLEIGYTVGYGTKDHVIFPYFAVVAALYGDGRPVRLANDRFDQFRTGLKRHAFHLSNTLLVDRASGAFRAMKGVYACNGGGRRNFSPEVAVVAATAAQSIYYLPKSDLSVAARSSRAVDAGSTRGYGTLQTMAATEMLVDEVAALLGLDPIELRRRNAVRTGMKNTQGAVPGGALRNLELLDRAEAHPLWRERAARKTAFEAGRPGWRYGTGFAQVQKDFGTGAEAAIVSLGFDAAGRLSMRHCGNDMGTGMTTSHAVMVAKVLGRIPDETAFGVVDWPEMPLVSDENPYAMPQAEEDERRQNPRWTPSVISPMTASNGAYYVGHATRSAARALFELSLWPTAVALWSAGPGGGQMASFSVTPAEARFVDGMLTAGGLEPLPLARLAAAAHAAGLVTAVSIHTFNRWQWAEATFDVPTVGTVRLPIDALSVRYGDGAPAERKALMTAGGFHFVERGAVFYPPAKRNDAAVTTYTGMATIAAVAVDTASGAVEIVAHHSVLECGSQVVPELVEGQLQGGLAMGIGHALLEELPLYEDGPGDGTWNWNRYRLPHARDVTVWTQTHEILPPISDTDPPKGMAEVVMIAVVPAIANAVADAIGTRFYATPITAEKIREALS